jgi:hypothetical protein
MPNATYSFEQVSKDFQLAGLPLAHCRYWTEAPFNAFKVAHLYPFYGYLPGNKVSLTKFNKTLRLTRSRTRQSWSITKQLQTLKAAFA